MAAVVHKATYLGEGSRRSFATPDHFVLTNKICLNQSYLLILVLDISTRYTDRQT